MLDDWIDISLAQRHIQYFITYTKEDYQLKEYHSQICHKAQLFAEGKIKKLMIFVAPQFGKTEITTRRLPCFLFGRNPNLKIASVSYSDTLAKRFNRDVQRILKSDEFYKVFPHVSLSRVRTDFNREYVANVSEFELVGHEGSYYSVGVGGGLTGRKVDIAIMDDVIKDASEANSQVYRDKVWEWYTSVLQTRLHNDSQQIITFTRWHEDDLAGRILAIEDDWDVLVIPALQDGESIWPERHNTKKLLDLKRLNSRNFESLYQQNPTPRDGNIMKREWFQIVKKTELPFNPDMIRKEFWIDGAYTDKVANDPTAIVITVFHAGNLYILGSVTKHMELYELLKYFPNYAEANGYSFRDIINIEPKASGKSLRSMLNKQKFNCIEIPNKTVSLGKITRAEDCSPTIESGKVFLLEGTWNESFINECCVFPNSKHDDQVDCLCYAIYKNFLTKKIMLK